MSGGLAQRACEAVGKGPLRPRLATPLSIINTTKKFFFF